MTVQAVADAEAEFDLAGLRTQVARQLSNAHDAASEAVADAFAALEKEINSLRSRIAELEGPAAEEKEEPPDLEAPIHALLDEVERPVGTLKAHLPDTPAAQAALIRLYDAVGRTL